MLERRKVSCFAYTKKGPTSLRALGHPPVALDRVMSIIAKPI